MLEVKQMDGYISTTSGTHTHASCLHKSTWGKEKTPVTTVFAQKVAEGEK